MEGEFNNRSQISEAARRAGATIIPIRSSKDGGLEVLCGQNLVLNYLKSGPRQRRTIMNFPGEFRFLGAMRKPIDVTPLDTAVRGLTSAGWHNAQRYIRSYVAERETLDRAALQATLFKVTGPGTKSGGSAKVFHFVCAMDPAVADHFASTLNQLLEAQQAYCVAHGEQLFSIPVAERAPLCPIFHSVSWWRIDDILERLQWDFINDFQRNEFAAHGLTNRASSGNSHMEVLRRLRHLCVEAAFNRAYRRELKALQMNLINRWDSKYYDLQACAPGFDKLQLLSFNLNVLPFGVALLHFGGRQHNFSRLQFFLNHVREALSDTPKKAAERDGLSNRRRGASGRVRLGFFTSRDAQSPKDATRALDVIALQELFASPFVPGFCSQTYAIREMSKLGYVAVTGASPSMWDLLRRGKWTDSGLVIFSRLPVVASKALRFSAGASLDAGACKGAIWARLELAKNKYLDVFNCHLQASHTGADGEVFERIRRSQLSELCDFIRLSGSEHPFVLTGDFNVDAIPEPLDPTGTFGISFRPPRLESDDYKQMIESLAPAGRLVDLLCGPTTEDPLGGAASQSERRHPCTRPPRLKLPGSMRYMAKHKYPQRLDYIFYRPTLPSLVEHSHTRIDTFEIRGCADFEHLSDHYGIRSHFRLRCGFAWRHSTQRSISEEKQPPPQKAGFRAGQTWRWALGTILLACVGVTFSQKCGFAYSVSAPCIWPSRRWHAGSFILLRELKAPLSSLLSSAMWSCAMAAFIVAVPVLASGAETVHEHADEESVVRQCSTDLEADEVAPLSPKEVDCSGISRTGPIAMSPYDSFTHTMEDSGGRRCIGRREVGTDGTLGDYVWLTYLEAQHEVLRISSGLHRKYGLKRNSRVGLLGDASAEWLLCDLALMRCGVDTVCVTAPSDESAKDLELLLCSPEWLENFVALAQDDASEGKSKICPIVTFKRVSPRIAAQAEYKGLQISDLDLVAHFGEAAGWVPYVGFGAWEVFTTMYRSRSGAKSDLQSVSVSLRDLARAAHTVAEALNLTSEDVHFSYSWPAFAAERVVLYAVLAKGGAIGFFSGTRSPRIFEEIRRLGPTFLQGSPSLFRRQITRLRHKHVGILGRMCFWIHSWALRKTQSATIDRNARRSILEKLVDLISSECSKVPLSKWLAAPFVHGRHALLGRKTRLRFVLALCTVGSTVLPPDRCLWMRVIFGCPVYKGLVVVEAGGLVTLGEAPYFSDSAMDAFVVGEALPGVNIDLLPWELPESQPMNVCGSHALRVEHGTMRVCGLNGTEARIGIVCGRRLGKMMVFGRLVSLVASTDGQPALCEALEQLFVQSSGPWLMQLLLTAESRGVVGVAVVRLEELWRHVKWGHIGTGRSGLEDLCSDKRVRAFCLSELQKCAKKHGLADWECPRAIYLESKPFSLEAGLQTPTLQLRRDQLLPRYQHIIAQLYIGLDVQDSETDLPSPRGNSPAVIRRLSLTRTTSAQWERG